MNIKEFFQRYERKLENFALFVTTAAMVLSGFAWSTLPARAADPGTPSTPISNNLVTPYIIAGANQGGNRTCSEVGLAFFEDANYYEFSSERFEEGAQLGGTAGPITWTTSPDEKFVSWSGNHDGLAVIVKGSRQANIYTYDNALGTFMTSDSGLASAPNQGGQTPTLSNITFCWNPAVVLLSQWCSPGYWRNHLTDAAFAASKGGFSLGDTYASQFGAAPAFSKKALKDGATSNPTLLQVLLNPQWYGGAAFNNVGDLLSEAHPDVNFTGERVEDSCPLSGVNTTTGGPRF